MNTFIYLYFYLVPGKLLLCGDLGFGGCLSPPVPPSPGMGSPPGMGSGLGVHPTAVKIIEMFNKIQKKINK